MIRCRITTSLMTITALLVVSTAAAQEKAPSGTVDIEQTAVRFLIGAMIGGGTLHFKGKAHPFNVGGLGIGGLGASKMSATGEVYDLNDVADFPGTYLQTRSGYAAGEGKGGLWMKNENNVVMRLEAKQRGLALSMGADGVVVKMK